MANDQQVERDELPAELRERLEQEFPGINMDFDPDEQRIAALLWLDEVQGHAREGDYVLIHYEILDHLWCDYRVGGTIEDPEVAQLYENACNDHSDATSDAYHKRIQKPFAVRLPDDPSLHEKVRGKTIMVAEMSEIETWLPPGEDFYFATVHADGTLVGTDSAVKRRDDLNDR